MSSTQVAIPGTMKAMFASGDSTALIARRLNLPLMTVRRERALAAAELPDRSTPDRGRERRSRLQRGLLKPPTRPSSPEIVARRARVIPLYEAGFSASKIALTLGVGESRVKDDISYARHRQGVSLDHRWNRRAERRKEVAEMLIGGSSVNDIATRFGVVRRQIEEDISQLGLVPPTKRVRQERLSLIRHLHLNGMGVSAMIERTGVTQATIYKDLKALGLTPNTRLVEASA